MWNGNDLPKSTKNDHTSKEESSKDCKGYRNLPKVEVNLTKNQVQSLRRLIGLKTKTNPEAVVKSVLKLLTDNPSYLEILEYEKKRN